MSSGFSQSGLPKGVVGRLVGAIMSWYNRPDNTWAISLLKAGGNDNILEVGFGPGQAIKMLASANASIKISGIEHSETMLTAARSLNSANIAAGRVALQLGKAEHLPFADASFDKALSINCIYFWKDPATGLRELHRVLKRGGCAVVTVRDSNSKAYADFRPEKLKKLISDAGFSSVSLHRNGVSSHPLLAVAALK